MSSVCQAEVFLNEQKMIRVLSPLDLHVMFSQRQTSNGKKRKSKAVAERHLYLFEHMATLFHPVGSMWALLPLATVNAAGEMGKYNGLYLYGALLSPYGTKTHGFQNKYFGALTLVASLALVSCNKICQPAPLIKTFPLFSLYRRWSVKMKIHSLIMAKSSALESLSALNDSLLLDLH